MIRFPVRLIFASYHQFNGNQTGGIPDSPTCFDQTRIASIAITKSPRDLTEQLRDHVFTPEKAQYPPPGVESAFFPQRDHSFREAANFFRLGFRSLYSLMLEKRGHKIPEQCPPVIGIPP
jgi:hypothetical protein